MPFRFMGSRGLGHATSPCQQPILLLFIVTTHHAPMIHAFFLFPMHSFLHVSHLYVFPPSLWLTWLTNPALVTLVYPNQMQYAPCILQEVSLLDGVDAGVHRNNRRFSKTSSYPPCCHYAYHPPFFLSLFSHDVIVPFVLADSFLLTTHFTPV